MGERIGPRATWRHGRRAAVVAALALTAATVVVVAAAPAGADVVTGSNTTAIAVPATGSPNQIGPAAPYPSAITISGLTGTVSDVDVTLSDVSHTIAADIDVLLVGPEGQNLILMSDAASGGGYPVNGTLTFDDAAAGPIPAVGAVEVNSVPLSLTIVRGLPRAAMSRRASSRLNTPATQAATYSPTL